MGAIKEILDIPILFFLQLNHQQNKLAFYSDLSGRNELYSLDIGTKELFKISDGQLPKSIREGFLWSSDDEYIIYHYDEFGSEVYSFKAISLKTREVIDLGLDPFHDQVLMHSSPKTDIFTFCSTRKGQLNLFGYDFRRRQFCQLTYHQNPAYGGYISPDGKSFIYQTNDADSPLNNDIYLYSFDDKSSTKLISLSDESNESFGSWSPEGDKVCFGTNIHGEMQTAIMYLKTREIEYFDLLPYGEAPVKLFKDHLLAFSRNEGSIILSLYDLNLRTKKKLNIASGVTNFITLADEEIYFVHDTWDSPSKLVRYHIPSDKSETLLDLMNIKLQESFVRDEHIWYPSQDGTMIPAIVYRPKSQTNKMPAMVIPHGGPTAQYYRVFNRIGQILAKMGYISIFPNVRGSTGYGTEFMNACINDWGGKDLEDWIAAHSWLVNNGADPNRIGIYGGSYGGFATLTCLGKYPSLWAAGIAFAPLTSFFTVHSSVSKNYQDWIERQMGKPDENEKLWRERSPITFCDNITAPLHIIHGSHDHRFPVTESQNLVHKLIELGRVEGKDFIYTELTDQGHGSMDPEESYELNKLILDYISSNV